MQSRVGVAVARIRSSLRGMPTPEAIEIPPVVATFLREIAPLRRDALSLRPLSVAESAKASQALRATMLLAAGLGAIVLVDPGNSDWYCYVSRGLQAGAVFQFDHDGGIEFAFPSLAAFAAALRKAVKGSVSIDDLPHSRAKPLGDQVALAARLVAWVGRDGVEGDVDALRELEAKVAAHLPRLDPDDIDTLAVVAASSNFLMREAAAVFMVAHARRAYIPLAKALAVDRYGQVWRPARAVLTALGAKPPPWTEDQEDEIVGDARGSTGLLFTLVRRANGKLRVTVDEVERKGQGAALSWRPYDSFGKYDFTPAELEDHRNGKPTLLRLLEEIGSAVVGRLELQPKLRKSQTPSQRKRR